MWASSLVRKRLKSEIHMTVSCVCVKNDANVFCVSPEMLCCAQNPNSIRNARHFCVSQCSFSVLKRPIISDYFHYFFSVMIVWCRTIHIYAEAAARLCTGHEFNHLSFCSWAFMLSTDIIRHSGYTQHTLDKEQSGSYQISFVSWGLVAVNVQGLFPSIQKLQSVTTQCLVPPVAVPQRALH